MRKTINTEQFIELYVSEIKEYNLLALADRGLARVRYNEPERIKRELEKAKEVVWRLRGILDELLGTDVDFEFFEEMGSLVGGEAYSICKLIVDGKAVWTLGE